MITPEVASARLDALDRGQATNVGVQNIYDIDRQASGQADPSAQATRERLAANTCTDVPGAEGFDTEAARWDNFMPQIERLADVDRPDFLALDSDTQNSIERSVNALAAGIAGGLIGDVVEFLNISYVRSNIWRPRAMPVR